MFRKKIRRIVRITKHIDRVKLVHFYLSFIYSLLPSEHIYIYHLEDSIMTEITQMEKIIRNEKTKKRNVTKFVI